jgi:uncharacterized membrane protein required for colicin V production
LNVIDFGIIGVIGVCALFGVFRGFVQSLLNLGGCLLSFLGAFWLFPTLADMVSANTGIVRLISSYTDSANLLGDLDLSSRAVDTLSQSNIQAIVQRANLPDPLGRLLTANISEKVFSPLGDLATSVGDYINQTILSVSINVLSFIVCFVGIFIVLSIVINLLNAVFRFPVLKQLDGLLGGLFGFAIGCVLCFIIFTAMPLLESVVPLEPFKQLVAGSSLANIFQNGSLIVSIMNRSI